MKHAKSAATPNPFDVRAMWGMTDKVLATEEDGYRVWLENATRMQSELASFWNQRLDKDVATVTAFGQCANPGEAFELQMNYARDAMADYYSEGQRVMQLMNDAAAECGLPAAGGSRWVGKAP
ncbi:MAG TPA: phasin family protein [Casimicrobiaceae bacterium]|nr:phasin family protein [Casimicrobiaceae bacterium]